MWLTVSRPGALQPQVQPHQDSHRGAGRFPTGCGIGLVSRQRCLGASVLGLIRFEPGTSDRRNGEHWTHSLSSGPERSRIHPMYWSERKYCPIDHGEEFV